MTSGSFPFDGTSPGNLSEHFQRTDSVGQRAHHPFSLKNIGSSKWVFSFTLGLWEPWTAGISNYQGAQKASILRPQDSPSLRKTSRTDFFFQEWKHGNLFPQCVPSTSCSPVCSLHVWASQLKTLCLIPSPAKLQIGQGTADSACLPNHSGDITLKTFKMLLCPNEEIILLRGFQRFA